MKKLIITLVMVMVLFSVNAHAVSRNVLDNRAVERQEVLVQRITDLETKIDKMAKMLKEFYEYRLEMDALEMDTEQIQTEQLENKM